MVKAHKSRDTIDKSIIMTMSEYQGKLLYKSYAEMPLWYPFPVQCWFGTRELGLPQVRSRGSYYAISVCKQRLNIKYSAVCFGDGRTVGYNDVGRGSKCV